MSLPCSSKHKKPVCDKCTAGTNCTKCCLCQPRSRGRPRKDSVSSDSETLARSNPERQARIHYDTVASASSALDMMPSIHLSDDRMEHVSASQAQILKVLELMDCEDGYESSVRRLPHIDVRRHVQYENELMLLPYNELIMYFVKASSLMTWVR